MDIRKNLSSDLVHRGILALALAWLVSGCDKLASERQRSQSSGYVATDSMGAEARDIGTVRVRGLRQLTESSAAAMSRSQAGLLFTINDSGHEPLLLALDTTGAARGVWRVVGATNVDWESAAIGTCGGATVAPLPGSECVYIGDTGDNSERHPFRVIYRVVEPTANGGSDSVRAEQLSYVYSDGPHDVEAMYVAQNGDMLLITKRPLADSASRLRPALVFLIPADAWEAKTQVTAQLVDSLPIVPGSAPLRAATDAAIAPDWKHMVVRTYAQAYIFATDPVTGRVDHNVPPAVCNIIPLGEAQGEGITWVDAAGRLAFTSEGRDATLHLATCPLP